MNLTDLQPQSLWAYFAQLNAVPRGSKKEERVSLFVQNFGHGLGLEVATDAVGNVLIRKPATVGLEQRPVVALQTHLDMVHQRNAGCNFDFDNQGIAMVIEGDWVRAQGTTLGADNGIGVAAAMAVLASTDIPHPPLEALFTIDEETGMTGAKGLQGGFLRARFLLNLDTENDNELTIGCAGGIDVVANGTYPQEPLPAEHRVFQLTVEGLSGGHSGLDIHLGRANANKLMNRCLFGAGAAFGVRLIRLEGGGLRNAIPRESAALVAVPTTQLEAFQDYLRQEEAVYRAEVRSTDPEFRLRCESSDETGTVVEGQLQQRFLRAVYAVPCGIARLSPEVAGLVQTSNNLARVQLCDGSFSIQCLCRGSLDSEKLDHARAIQCSLELISDATQVTLEGGYCGWTPNPASPLVKMMSGLYEEMFGERPHVSACHAGLECGILGTNYPELDMISFGPNIRGAHSPDETVQISSVQKFWRYLGQALERVGA